MSLTQAAALLGIHRNTLSTWIDQGCPVEKRADRGSGQEWELLVARIFEWRLAEQDLAERWADDRDDTADDTAV